MRERERERERRGEMRVLWRRGEIESDGEGRYE
jgi:hypothetical protein